MKAIVLLLAVTSVLIACDKKVDESGAALSTNSVAGAKGKGELLTDDIVIPVKREFKESTKIKACDDFYGHVCSEALSSFKRPSDKSSWTFAFSDSAERIKRIKKKYLKEISVMDIKEANFTSKNSASDSDLLNGPKQRMARVQQVKDNFTACMNDKVAKTDELRFIEEIKGEVNRISRRNDILSYFARAMVTPGRFSLVNIGPIANHDDPLVRDLYIETESSEFSHRDYYAKPEIKKDYIALVDAFFKIFDPSSDKRWGEAFHAFEKKNAEILPLPEEWRKIITEKDYTTLDDLIETYPNLGLSRIFSTISVSIRVRNFTPESYAFVNKAIRELPIDMLKAYIAFKTLSGKIDLSYPDYFQMKFDFSKKHFGGADIRAPKLTRCTNFIAHRFGKELDFELIGKIFPNFDEDKFLGILNKVKASIVQGIKENKWLDKKSKAGALDKMKKLTFQVVKPANYLDWDFNEVAIYSAKSKFENDFTYTQLKIKKLLEDFGRKIRPTIWGTSPLVVNAYYSPSKNKFVMPMGILQYPFYDESLSDAANFGAVGMVVGHEVGHGIDDQGAKYDGSGRVKKWMSDKSLKIFKEKSSSIGKYYKAYGMNPELTMGENIGDLTGLQFAYNAAFPDNSGKVEDKKAFFSQFARVWCTTMKKSLYDKRVKTDPHSQVPARVEAPVLHLDGFYEAYSCTAKDKMFVPKKDRIKIW